MSFTSTITALRYGKLHNELDKSLATLVDACTDTGKVGELTLTIKLKPGKGGQIEVFDNVKLKAPAHERGTTLMFPTPEGELQREDPRQMRIDEVRTVDTHLPVRAINHQPAPVRN